MTEKKLIGKLASIIEEIERIPENGFNDFHNYSYATESDIKAVVRKKMAERKLVMIPDVVKEITKQVTTAKGKTENLTTLEIIYYISDGETGESIAFKGIGTGQDSGDKAVYKAQTGALKYALTTLFLIPTGQDPEKEGKPLQPPKRIDEKQVAILEKIIQSVSEITNQEREILEANIHEKTEIITPFDQLNRNEYGTVLNYVNGLKLKAEKKFKKNVVIEEPDRKLENKAPLSWGDF